MGFSHLCVTGVCTLTHTPRGGGPPGLRLSQHQAGLPQRGAGGKQCAPHRCEFLTPENKACSPGGSAGPPRRAACLCSSCEASLWICKYFNSQKLKERGWVGGGWGGLLAVPSVFIQAFPSPLSGNSILETCSGVLVPYTRHELDRPVGGGAGSSGLGPVGGGEAGPPSHRVRTATG